MPRKQPSRDFEDLGVEGGEKGDGGGSSDGDGENGDRVRDRDEAEANRDEIMI